MLQHSMTEYSPTHRSICPTTLLVKHMRNTYIYIYIYIHKLYIYIPTYIYIYIYGYHAKYVPGCFFDDAIRFAFSVYSDFVIALMQRTKHLAKMQRRPRHDLSTLRSDTQAF